MKSNYFFRLLSKKKVKPKTIFFLLLFVFSVFLMSKTFNVNRSGNLEIASKAWSDFAATIPLIRSFSFGSNFPPQYPIFAGPPICYHFIFFFVVGMLEKFGLPLDWALNSLSSISFFLLLVVIYVLGKTVFKKRAVGVLAVLLFLFNSSLSFLEFFKTHPIGPNTIFDIIHNTTFPSFGPYDGKIVSAFWSLNIFTNQRHLALAYASFLFLVFYIFKFSKKPKKLTLKKSAVVGIVIGIFPFIHLAVFGMMGLALMVFFLIFPKIRKQIFAIGLVALFISIPQIIYMGSSQVNVEFFNPGYLVENLTLINFISYWFFNFGFTALFLPIGLMIASKKQRSFFLIFFILFIVGNLFQFSPDMPTNHKFFNLFIIGANLFTANFLIHIWNKHTFGKSTVPFLLLLLTLSGIIDVFPILNDRRIELIDYPNDPTVKYIVENTPKDAVFLNSSYLYNPASLAGRKIFMGWPYFPWSAGYDTHKRGGTMDQIYTSKNKIQTCQLLRENNINYITTQNTTNNSNMPPIDLEYFEDNFSLIFQNQGLFIYDVKQSCL